MDFWLSGACFPPTESMIFVRRTERTQNKQGNKERTYRMFLTESRHSRLKAKCF